jgi:hypothetical protein
LEKAHQRQLMMDEKKAEHPPVRDKHSKDSAGHNADKEHHQHQQRNQRSGGMPSQRPTSAVGSDLRAAYHNWNSACHFAFALQFACLANSGRLLLIE